MNERDQNLTTADLAAGAQESTEEVDREREMPPETRAGDGTTSAVEERPAAPEAAADDSERLESLVATEEADSFRERWSSIQTGFVDEPRQAVEQADGLVAELMQRLAQTFSEERQNLESQWSRGDDASTEDLRVGLQRYRSFFERLLST